MYNRCPHTGIQLKADRVYRPKNIYDNRYIFLDKNTNIPSYILTATLVIGYLTSLFFIVFSL